MTILEAKIVLENMNRWRRDEGEFRLHVGEPPHTATEFGIAIDTAVKAMDLLITKTFNNE